MLVLASILLQANNQTRSDLDCEKYSILVKKLYPSRKAEILPKKLNKKNNGENFGKKAFNDHFCIGLPIFFNGLLLSSNGLNY